MPEEYRGHRGLCVRGFLRRHPERLCLGGARAVRRRAGIPGSVLYPCVGIGKALFLAAEDWARARGGRKLYISAHSAVESQAFYKAMGCVEAEKYHQGHVEAEPYDCQLECEL